MKHLVIISTLVLSVVLIVISKPEAKVDSKKEYFELKAKINHVVKLTKCDSG